MHHPGYAKFVAPSKVDRAQSTNIQAIVYRIRAMHISGEAKLPSSSERVLVVSRVRERLPAVAGTTAVRGRWTWLAGRESRAALGAAVEQRPRA